MKKAMFHILFYVSLLVFGRAEAEILAKSENGTITIEEASTKEITDLFEKYGFTDFSGVKIKVPRIYIKKLPSDWISIKDSQEKHRMFIKMMLPLVLKVNEDILKERAEIERIAEKFKKDENISSEDWDFLEKKAQKYDVFTRLKGNSRASLLIKKLLEKVDILPPSIMVVSAGIYTNWGTSRLAIEANSLYLQEIWYQNDGIAPLDDENADYRYKTYAMLEDCIADHAFRINSHINYDYLRAARLMNRQMGYPPYSPQFAAQMLFDNNLKNIAGIIDYTLTFYGMKNTDFLPALEDVK